jgi:hypothetical protein
MSTELGIGKLITDPGQGRDAIHIAVAPMTASAAMEAGTKVDAQGRCFSDCPIGQWKPVGIVDPFLPKPVQPGQRFWVFLFPDTVTSLRHVWTHPAFAPKPPEVK